jgi:hypothetical protein
VYVASLSEISIRRPGTKADAPAHRVHLEVLANLCGADNERGPARDIGPTSAYRIGAVQVDEAISRAVLSASSHSILRQRLPLPSHSKATTMARQ